MKEVLLRSMLYVPAYNKRFIDNALKCNADALIIDLEDSVPELYKPEARKITKEYLENSTFTGKNIFIRLNPLESKMVFEDLKFVLHSDVVGYQLTKIKTADDISYYDKLFSQYESELGFEDGYFKFAPLIETTSAVMDVYNIAKATTRNVAICFGGEDFLNDLAGLHGEPPRAFDYPRAAIALAARAAGILPIDTPYLSLDDHEGFIAEETISFEMGFAGTLIIHPKQISLAHKCFTPVETEIIRSRQIVDAISEAQKKGTGVAILDGKMIGPPMKKRAENVLKIMKLIQSRAE